MSRKVKIAISLSREALELVDRNAAGRSRSACIQEELVRALRAREWAILSAATSTAEADESVDWAEHAFRLVDEQLAADEVESIQPLRRRGHSKKAKSPSLHRHPRAGGADRA